MDRVFFKVKNKKNGGIYVIGETKYKKEQDRWELFNEKDPFEGLEVVDISPEPEMTYFEIKEELLNLGITFKGNAPKEELLALLKEAKEK